jgi:outer membrane protein assembly factor BamB
MSTQSLAFLLCIITMGHATAENWPMWRGAKGDGTCSERNLPEKWSTTENVVWKTKLPDRGNSTPVIWGQKVFVTQCIEKENRRLLLCFDKETGNSLWQAGMVFDQAEPTHSTNPYCSASPATDGERVIVFFASAGVYCYDTDGKEIWKRTDLGPQHHIWGNGTSPVINGDRVYLNFGPGANTVLYCFDKHTGKTLWKHTEPGGDSGGGAGKKWLGSWSDPLVREINGSPQLFMSYPSRVCAFDAAGGKELWTCDGLTKLVYNSPLFADDTVIAMSGYNGAALAVKTGGSGDVTSTHRVWHLPKVSQRIGSGVIHEGHHYILSDGGLAECRNIKTGELVFTERLKGPGSTGQNWSSLVLSSDGNLYAVNQGGDSFVWKARPKFELLGTNSLGEKVIASIAISNGRLYIRGHQNLWCIGRK